MTSRSKAKLIFLCIKSHVLCKSINKNKAWHHSIGRLLNYVFAHIILPAKDDARKRVPLYTTKRFLLCVLQIYATKPTNAS